MSISEYPVVKTSEAVVTEGQTTIAISRNDGTKGKSGLCCVVPVLSDSVLTLIFNSQEGKIFFTDVLDSVRSRIASGLHAKKEIISSDKLGIDGILNAIRAANSSGRLTAKAIVEWFDCSLQKLIVSAVVAKNPSISADKCEKIADSYRQKFARLSAKNGCFSEDEKTAMQKVLLLIPEDSEIAQNPLTVKISEAVSDIEGIEELI